jgi:hypothetical protein
MAENYRVARDIGILPATEGSEIKFSIDEYRGHKYGSIRKYLKRQSYTGPTRSGITFNKEIAAGILQALKELSQDAPAQDEKELGIFAKKPGLSVKLRLTTYQGLKGIDIREWQENVSYKGWTKRGIRLSYKDLDKIIEYLAKIVDLMPAPDEEKK